MNAKKALLVLVVLFVGFWLFTDPNGLANAGRDGAGWIWDLLVGLFRSLIDFLDAL
ncbi:MAG: hypothetical protein ACI379_08400 [Nocardioides sp.]|uniref:hypothetical protein n=1 Tax=Nocardioides sp. TaxID=35761 RepID=UPI003F0B5E67